MNRIPIPNKNKIRSILQQEINSICPFCDNKDVEHFHIHHIDENNSNNIINNLILLCPLCHSKITKGDIAKSHVQKIKNELPNKNSIEIASISIDSNNCNWIRFDDTPLAFFEKNNNKSPFPIFNFVLINHSNKTVIFTDINLLSKMLYSGFSGLPKPNVLKSLATFKIQLPINNITRFQLPNEIEFPPKSSMKFQIQLYDFDSYENKIINIHGRHVVNFSFIFNNSITVNLPTVFLNCKYDNQPLKLVTLE